MALSRSPEGVEVTLGFASTEDAEVQVKRGELIGPHIDALRRAAKIVRHAFESPGLAGVVAREELGWVLWPAVLGSERDQGRFAELVEGIVHGAPFATRAVLLVPPLKSAPRSQEALKIDDAPVEFLPMTVETLKELMLAPG